MVQIVVPGMPAPAAASITAAPVLVVDDFLPAELAEAMRRDIEGHFADPHKHRPQSHQVWNYWFVPETYTYLRTLAHNVIAGQRIDALLQRLTGWTTENLGLSRVSRPFLSLYVDGCHQGWHNDSMNGRFAFVYSLTRNERRTSGGETLVMRDGDPLRRNLTSSAAGRSLYEAVAPRFNRLVIFDDRAPHAVQRVEGSMDPVEGRFVLHGHISEGGIVVRGARPAEAVDQALQGALLSFAAAADAELAPYHGPLSLRLAIDAAGKVEVGDFILDRVLYPGGVAEGWEDLRERLCTHLEAMSFPEAAADTSVILPVTFGHRPGAML